MSIASLISEAVSQHTGTMVALYIPQVIANSLAVSGGEAPDSLHVTLAYIKDVDFEDILKVTQKVAMRWSTVAGTVGGVGRFNPSETSDDKHVIYASFDSPTLTTLREYLIAELMNAGINPSMKHGFTPHITLKYTDDPTEVNSIEAPRAELNIPALSVVQGDQQRVDCVFGSRPIWPS